MTKQETAAEIAQGQVFLGIEFGSTRIKAVLTNAEHSVIAAGSHTWENRQENGYWTYSANDIINGLQSCYRSLSDDIYKKYGAALTHPAAIGISAMMHGYMPFDADGKLLVPFRTWRNTTTETAANKLSELFGFNIPQRWSIAHLYQAMLDREEHIGRIDNLTTLAGYIHRLLTEENVLGIGDASGMFPIDSKGMCYDKAMISAFEKAALNEGYSVSLEKLLPKILPAGEAAGKLTAEGTALLDPTGKLEAGVPLCPPEGDAGTGMTATNSVSERTGNVSAGTSVFAMVVLEKPLSRAYPEVDMVTTPSGEPVAMVHCNNCSSDIDAWAGLLNAFAGASGANADMGKTYEILFSAAADGKPDCAGIAACNYLSGEPITGLSEGRPLIMRTPEARLTLADFSRALLCSAVATLRIGMKLLLENENVRIDRLLGHGGYFKTGSAGREILAAALGAPVSTAENAGEGGPWGMALLAAYMIQKKESETLGEYLSSRVFADASLVTAEPDPAQIEGFNAYAELYEKCLNAERAAIL